MIARLLGALLAVSIGGNIFQAVDKYGLGAWIEGDRDRIARLQADLASIKAASDAAISLQMAASEAVESRYSQLAKESTHAHQIATERARSAVAAYAIAHPVRLCARTVGSPLGATGGTSLPPDSPPLGQDGADTGMVGITRKELDQLSGAALQNVERGNFLNALIDEGLAIPAPSF